MKIDNINNYVNYHKKTSLVKKKNNCLSEKCDKIKINKSNIKSAKNIDVKDISEIKNSLISEINDKNDLEKIDNLKFRIKNNSYNVNSNELAKILLNL